MTTLQKAKEVKPFAEKLITLARRGNAAKERGDRPGYLHCFRMAVATLGGNRQANRLAKQLFDEIAPQFRDRSGGYTRVVRHWKGRLGDNAPQALFELVGYTPAAREGAAEEGAGEAEGGKAAGGKAAGGKAAGGTAEGEKAEGKE